MKKFLITILIVGLLAGGGYYYWAQMEASKNAADKILTVTKVSDYQAVSPLVSSDGNSIWFGDNKGYIYKTNVTGGSTTQIPSPVFTGEYLSRIFWSPDRDKFIAVGTMMQKDYYFSFNPATNQYTPLAKNVLSIDWMPDSARVVLVWRSTDNKSEQLVVSNADGTGYKSIAQLPVVDYEVKVSPSGGEALLVSKNPTNNKIYLINLTDGGFKALVEEGNSLGVMWLNSNQFLYTIQDQLYPKLYSYDLKTNTKDDLKVNATIDRVTVDNTSSALFVVERIGSDDQIKKINLGSLTSSSYFNLVERKVKQLFYGRGVLYFIDGADNKIYSIK